ncbi:MAG: putative AP-2 complex subunit alpha-2, partial [Streblomastix strix]
DGQGGERTKEKDGRDIIQKSVNHVRYFLSFQDPDLRYLALESIQHLCALDPDSTGNDSKFVAAVEKTLHHPDLSLRRRAVDVLFEMCSEDNSEQIVGQLVDYLDEAEETEIKNELVIKIAILAEKYPVDTPWYVDVMMRLVQTAGDSAPQEIWYRTVQIVSSHPNMQSYAATTAAVML